MSTITYQQAVQLTVDGRRLVNVELYREYIAREFGVYLICGGSGKQLTRAYRHCERLARACGLAREEVIETAKVDAELLAE